MTPQGPVDPVPPEPVEKPRRMGRLIIRFTILVLAAGGSVAGAIYAGYIPV